MRVAFFSGFFPTVNGGARCTQALAEYLLGEGHGVTVVTPKELGPHKELPYDVRRTRDFGPMVAAARESDHVICSGLSTRTVMASLSGGRLPVIQHHLHTAICPAGTPSASGEPCTATFSRPTPCATCPRREPKAYLDAARWRSCVLLGRRNVCVSRYLARRLSMPRTSTIYNPVDPRAFIPGDPGPGRDGLVVYAGRLEPSKGLGVLIRALSLLPGTTLKVVGGPPSMVSVWAETTRQYGVEHRVHFLGSTAIEQIVELYAEAAVVCVPSLHHETFGYAAAEAMAVGRAVVATPVGALPELLEDGRGFVAGGLDPEGLADVLRTALEDGQAKKEAERRARVFAESELSVASVGGKYVQLLQSP